jgi:hypothetical protein
LPTIKELGSINNPVKFNPSVDTKYFPDTVFDEFSRPYYYSSTSVSPNINFAWRWIFKGGSANPFRKERTLNDYYVRAVRSGQSGPLGHLVILSPKQASSWDNDSLMPVHWLTSGLGSDVKISISRQGGLDGSFETIIETTSNDGQEEWTVTGAGSVNCVIKIEQVDDPSNWASEGLFVIQDAVNHVFYEQYYLAQHPDAARAVEKGLFGSGWEHYQACGKYEGRSYAKPNAYVDFNEAYYMARNPDVARAVEKGIFGTGWDHFSACGKSEGRTYAKPNGYGDFSEEYYLARNSDVTRAVEKGVFGTGWDHFSACGASEGRSYAKPDAYGDFNEIYYLAQNPDVARAVEAGIFGTGWDHFSACGKSEGRRYAKPEDYEGIVYGGMLP